MRIENAALIDYRYQFTLKQMLSFNECGRIRKDYLRKMSAWTFTNLSMVIIYLSLLYL